MSQSTAVPVTVTFVQRNAVHELRPCLPVLTTADAQLIRTQFALDGRPIPSVAAVAAQLHETPSAEYTAVVFSLRKMESAAHRGQCGLLSALPASDSTAPASAGSRVRTARPTAANVIVPKAVSRPPAAAVVPPATTPSHLVSLSHAPEIGGAVVVLLALVAGLALGVRRRRPAAAGAGAAVVSREPSGSDGLARTVRQSPRPGLRLRRDRLMRTAPRARRYVSRLSLIMLRPFFRRSLTRDAYVLRVIGDRFGPVLREDRRRKRLAREGPERRRARHGVGQPTT